MSSGINVKNINKQEFICQNLKLLVSKKRQLLNFIFINVLFRLKLKKFEILEYLLTLIQGRQLLQKGFCSILAGSMKCMRYSIFFILILRSPLVNLIELTFLIAIFD